MTNAALHAGGGDMTCAAVDLTLTAGARTLLDRVWALDEVQDIRSLRKLLQPAA